MSPAAQHLALAELDGWVRGDDCEIVYGSGRLFPRWYRGNEGAHLGELPEYLKDLNALHQIETKRLSVAEGFRYPDVLTDTVHRHWRERGSVPVTCPAAHVASAAQRAEAILRATGKWDDSL